MIVWLASYPKSGNTFLRSLLSAYLFTEDGKFKFESLNHISQFPDLKIFKKFGINISDELEIVKNYLNIQQKLNSKNISSLKFLKTHSSLNDINGYKFTDLKNSLGVIYIVRDPRSVAKSYANHNQMTLEMATNNLFKFVTLTDERKHSDQVVNQAVTHVGSWSSNYNSWKEFKKVNRYLLVKYEDLVLNTDKCFREILKFIFEIGKSSFQINTKKFENTLESTTFSRMQKLELEKGFPEAIKDINGSKITFFKYGLRDNDPNSFPKDLNEKIKSKFFHELNELSYI